MGPTSSTVSRPPTLLERIWDRGFCNGSWLIAWLSVGLLLLVVLEIGKEAIPAVKQHGLNLALSTEWDTAQDRYGILPHIFGTLYSSILALLLGTVFGVAVAIFITEDFLPPWCRTLLKNIIELLAAIPSVIYGLWGMFVVQNFLQGPAGWLHNTLGDVPVIGVFFSTGYNGPSMLTASLVLAIMILPTITALSRDAIANVPPRLREGAIGLGATRWEAILKVVLPTASTGIFGAAILAFGRALGETMALAMLAGNSDTISWSVLAPGNTLAAVMANSFDVAQGNAPYVSALMYAALVLMLITLVVNILGSLVIWHASNKLRGLR